MDVVNLQRKQLSHWILNLVGDVEFNIGTQLVRACLIHVFNTVSLFAFTSLHLDLRNAIADLRLITGVTLSHTIGQYAMCNGTIKIRKTLFRNERLNVVLLKLPIASCPINEFTLTLSRTPLTCRSGFLNPRRWNDRNVIIPQRLTHDVLLQRNLMAQNLLQSLRDKRLCLANVSVVQQDIQSTAKHLLHNRCIITTLQNDTHGLPLGLDVGVIFLHHADLTLATEQDERIERLFLANDLWLTALLRDAIRSLHTQLNALGDILRRKANEDRVGIALHNIRTKLRLHNILGKQQLLATRSRGRCRNTETTNRRRTAARLTLHRVCDDLVGQLKTIENRLLTFVREGLRKLASFLTLLQQDVQHQRENARTQFLFSRLDLRAGCTAYHDSFVVLVVLADVVHNLALGLQGTQSIGGKTPALTGNELALRSLDTLTHQCVGRNVVGNHVGRLQRVEIQNTDGLIEVHIDLGLNHDGTLLRPIFRFGFTAILSPQNLIALAGNGCNSREDLDSLTPKQHEAHGNLADLGHTASIDNRIQLGHERENQVTILNTLPSNAGTLRRTLTMQCEEFLCRNIVLRKRPFEILGSILENVLGQHELVGSHLFHNDLVALRIRRVSHDLKSHIILGTETTGALGVDLATLNLADLVAKEDRRNTIKLEALERMLTTHVQKKINAQTTRSIPVAKILLAGRKLEGLGHEMACLLGRNATKLNLIFNPQHLAAIHKVSIVKAEGVLPADDVGVDFTELVAEGQNQFLFRRATHELGMGFHGSQNEYLACRRIKKITRGTRTHTNLNNRIPLVGNVPHCGKLFSLSVFQSVHDTRTSKKCGDRSTTDDDLFLPHAFLQNLRQGPIFRSFLHIAARTLKHGNPLLLTPDTLGHGELTMTRLHLQILTHNLQRNVRRTGLERHMRSRLHHIHLHILTSLGLASRKAERRTRTQIVFVEDAKKRRKIRFLHDTLGCHHNTLEFAKGVQGCDLKLPDGSGLVFLKSSHDILLGHPSGKAGRLQEPHNTRRCLIVLCGDVEIRLESSDSNTPHTSIFQTSLRVDDLLLGVVHEGVMLVPITGLELHSATPHGMRKRVSVFPCPPSKCRES